MNAPILCQPFGKSLPSAQATRLSPATATYDPQKPNRCEKKRTLEGSWAYHVPKKISEPTIFRDVTEETREVFMSTVQGGQDDRLGIKRERAAGSNKRVRAQTCRQLCLSSNSSQE
ncbi:hypothetical protein NDU88_006347 [Pleurodeles waltl]|uniref:Uncharacterized protein n=1 Tax=Pleurodeles waltl TaxID=8319 RepID=A0AAV7PM58_PLEWA|nr:hypothetical protein NDU88_006347 [Pleurodeles waltl]